MPHYTLRQMCAITKSGQGPPDKATGCDTLSPVNGAQSPQLEPSTGLRNVSETRTRSSPTLGASCRRDAEQMPSASGGLRRTVRRPVAIVAGGDTGLVARIVGELFPRGKIVGGAPRIPPDDAAVAGAVRRRLRGRPERGGTARLP